MNIFESNKFIAEFMGYEKRVESNTLQNYYYPKDCLKDYLFTECREDLLSFHEDWNWLIPVIEKIEDLIIDKFPIIVTISKNGAYIGFNQSNCAGEYKEGKLEIVNTLNINYFILNENEQYSKISGTYEAIIRFIKWYNKQIK